MPLSWQECYELLESRGIDYFIAKNRACVLMRKFIAAYERPNVRMKRLGLKFEVVKESLGAFQLWLEGN